MRVKFPSLIRCFLTVSSIILFTPAIGKSFLEASSPPVSHEQVQGGVQGEVPVQATLLSEDKGLQAGKPFWVGVELKMANGWDTYWVNPGDAGFPTKVEWHLPDGFQAGPIQWPYPERFTAQSLVGYGYTDSVMLLTQITPPKNLPVGEQIKLEADVSWLACKEQCVPGNAHLQLQLPVVATTPEQDTQTAAIFSEARQLLPKSLSAEEGAVQFAAQAEELVLNFKPSSQLFGEVAEMIFIPEHGEVIDHGAPQNLTKAEEGFSLNMKLAHPGQTPSALKGILLVSEAGTGLKHAIQIDTSSQAAASSAATVGGVSSFGVALALAFLGGIILNVMPCVLPVIALKIFGFVKLAGERRSVILKHGGIFTLGVLVSFWILTAALLVLRAYGQGVGWGFQLQEPAFVAILASVLFLFGLSLFGVFEMGTSLISLGQKASKSGSPAMSSFMSGVLATLVATPCTGPLLGPALGFAMTLPTMMSVSIFTAMGLGMAFPYMLFSAFPKLVRFLPKPGNWMIIFKQLMGFVMMGTVVWLAWVFGAQTDLMAIFFLLVALLLIAVGAWIFGRWGTPLHKKMTRVISSCVAFTLFIFAGYGLVSTAQQSKQLNASSSNLVVGDVEEGTSWIAYTPEKVEQFRQQGHPVFVDFTAKWCLICQANKVTLHSSNVTKAFEEKGVVTMTADWTKRDAYITQELEKLGRTGVPVYVLYPADPTQQPYILPQTLSESAVMEYLNKLDQTTVYAD